MSVPRCWSAGTAAAAVLILFLGLTTVESKDFTITEGGQTIQSALDAAEPGDVISIESGHYFEDLVTTIDGTEDKRITIQGVDGAENVVIRGAGTSSRVFQVQHDYYTIQDFTIDGYIRDDVPRGDITEDDVKEAFRDILIYVTANRDATERSGGYMSALDGLVMTGMTIQNARSECIRLRYFVTYAEIYSNTILDCGLEDFAYNEEILEGEGKNGEGIYLGTAFSQWNDEKYDYRGEDICLENVIRDNEIITNGNEGIDVKEGCLNTRIEDNYISLQHDDDAGGISSHADFTTITGNVIENVAGAGVRVGTSDVDNPYGVYNTVTGNTINDCTSYGVKIVSMPQTSICGNFVEELPTGQTEDTYKYSGGTYGDEFEPFEDCPSFVVYDAKYLGCFTDVWGDRTMDWAFNRRKTMTNEACIEHCRDDGQRFAGTENGKQCRCTNTESDVDKHGVSTECTVECPGDSDTICGGSKAVTSWEII